MTRPIRIAHVATVDSTLRFMLLAQLRRLAEEGFDVAAISAPGPWVPEIEAEGIRHIPWRHATRSWSPLRDALAFAELVRILRRERFDLVHTHNPKPGILGRVAARLAGVPCVLNTVHGLYATPQDRARKRIPILAVERWAARFSDRELYQSEEDLDWARRLGMVDAANSAHLGNGIDLSRFDPGAVSAQSLAALRSELGIPDGSLVVGTVGRLVAEKGYGDLLDAARTIRGRLPDVRFIAIGDADPAKPDSIDAAAVEAAGDDMLFLGWRNDVRDILALMDVFVLPSWREGIPRSAIEAAAMGRAMVLTDIRGCREVARDGLEALLVPPRDPDRLAVAVEQLLRDARLRLGLGTAARTRALQVFDERRVVESIVSHSREILARKGVVEGAFRRRPSAEAARG